MFNSQFHSGHARMRKKPLKYQYQVLEENENEVV